LLEQLITNPHIDLELLKSYITQIKIKRINGRIRRYFCIILLNMGGESSQEAKHWIEKAIAYDQENKLLYELGMDHTVYADFSKQTGNIIKAKERLDNARDIFKECGADGWVKKIEIELAEL